MARSPVPRGLRRGALLGLLTLACAGPPREGVPVPPIPEGQAGSIHLAFQAVDCSIYSRDIRRLAGVARAGSVAVSGTMILGMISPAEVPALIADYHLDFPVTADPAGEYLRLFQYLGTPGPVVVVRRRGQVVALLVGPMALSRATRELASGKGSLTP